MTFEVARPQVIYVDLGAPAAVIVRRDHDTIVIADPHVSANQLGAAVATAAILDADDVLVGSVPQPREPGDGAGGG